MMITGGNETMYDRRFFATTLGKAAIVSIAAMLSFNVLALSQQMRAAAPLALVSQSVELA